MSEQFVSMNIECDVFVEINCSHSFDLNSDLLFTYTIVMSQARTKSARICRIIEKIRVAIGILTVFTAALTATTRITWESLTYQSTIRNRRLNHRVPTRATNSTASFIITAAHSGTAIIIYRPIRTRFTAEAEGARNAPSEPVRVSGSAEESYERRI